MFLFKKTSAVLSFATFAFVLMLGSSELQAMMEGKKQVAKEESKERKNLLEVYPLTEDGNSKLKQEALNVASLELLGELMRRYEKKQITFAEDDKDNVAEKLMKLAEALSKKGPNLKRDFGTAAELCLKAAALGNTTAMGVYTGLAEKVKEVYEDREREIQGKKLLAVYLQDKRPKSAGFYLKLAELSIDNHSNSHARPDFEQAAEYYLKVRAHSDTTPEEKKLAEEAYLGLAEKVKKVYHDKERETQGKKLLALYSQDEGLKSVRFYLNLAELSIDNHSSTQARPDFRLAAEWYLKVRAHSDVTPKEKEFAEEAYLGLAGKVSGIYYSEKREIQCRKLMAVYLQDEGPKSVRFYLNLAKLSINNHSSYEAKPDFRLAAECYLKVRAHSDVTAEEKEFAEEAYLGLPEKLKNMYRGEYKKKQREKLMDVYLQDPGLQDVEFLLSLASRCTTEDSDTATFGRAAELYLKVMGLDNAKEEDKTTARKAYYELDKTVRLMRDETTSSEELVPVYLRHATEEDIPFLNKLADRFESENSRNWGLAARCYLKLANLKSKDAKERFYALLKKFDKLSERRREEQAGGLHAAFLEEEVNEDIQVVAFLNKYYQDRYFLIGVLDYYLKTDSEAFFKKALELHEKYKSRLTESSGYRSFLEGVLKYYVCKNDEASMEAALAFYGKYNSFLGQTESSKFLEKVLCYYMEKGGETSVQRATEIYDEYKTIAKPNARQLEGLRDHYVSKADRGDRVACGRVVEMALGFQHYQEMHGLAVQYCFKAVALGDSKDKLYEIFERMPTEGGYLNSDAVCAFFPRCLQEVANGDTRLAELLEKNYHNKAFLAGALSAYVKVGDEASIQRAVEIYDQYKTVAKPGASDLTKLRDYYLQKANQGDINACYKVIEMALGFQDKTKSESQVDYADATQGYVKLIDLKVEGAKEKFYKFLEGVNSHFFTSQFTNGFSSFSETFSKWADTQADARLFFLLGNIFAENGLNSYRTLSARYYFQAMALGHVEAKTAVDVPLRELKKISSDSKKKFADKFVAEIFPLYLREAEKGESRFYRVLASEYISGELVGKDLTKALTYSVAAGRLENQSPITIHSNFLAAWKAAWKDVSTEDNEKIKAVYEEEAKNEDPLGFLLLGEFYQAIDKTKASEHYSKAEQTDDVQTHMSFARMHLEGHAYLGGAVDFGKAAERYLRAAALGHAEAGKKFLGLFDEVESVSNPSQREAQSKALAVVFEGEAAAKQDADLYVILGDQYAHNNDLQDFGKAAECYVKAAALGDLEAEKKFRGLFNELESVSNPSQKGAQSMALAVIFGREAEARKDADLYLILGDQCVRNYYLKNLEKAAEYYLKAGALKHAEAENKFRLVFDEVKTIFNNHDRLAQWKALVAIFEREAAVRMNAQLYIFVGDQYENKPDKIDFVAAAGCYLNALMLKDATAMTAFDKLLNKIKKSTENHKYLANRIHADSMTILPPESVQAYSIRAKLYEIEGEDKEAITHYLKAGMLGDTAGVHEAWRCYRKKDINDHSNVSLFDYKEHTLVPLSKRLEALEQEVENQNPHAAYLVAKASFQNIRKHVEHQIMAAKWGHPDALKEVEALYQEVTKTPKLTDPQREGFAPLLHYYLELAAHGDQTLDLKIAEMYADDIVVNPTIASQNETMEIDESRKLSESEQIQTLKSALAERTREARELQERNKVTAVERYEREIRRLVTLADTGDQGAYMAARELQKKLETRKFKPEQKVTLFKPLFDYELKRAGEDNLEAKLRVAQAYKVGNGILRDIKYAACYYLEVLKGNNVDLLQTAHSEFYGLYKFSAENPQELETLFPIYLSQACKGSAPAQHVVGKMYLKGRGIEVNYAEALKWFEESWKQKFERSARRLGQLHELGRGVEPNLEKAFCYYKAGKSKKGVGKYISFNTPTGSYSVTDWNQLNEPMANFLDAFAIPSTHAALSQKDPAFSFDPEADEIEQKVSFLSKVSPKELASRREGLLMRDVSVRTVVPDFIQTFDILGKSYVAIGRENCILARFIQEALTHRLTDGHIDREIRGNTNSIEEINGRLRTQRGLAVESEAERAILKNMLTTKERFVTDSKRLRAYQTAISTLENVVKNGGWGRRADFLKDDECGFMR